MENRKSLFEEKKDESVARLKSDKKTLLRSEYIPDRRTSKRIPWYGDCEFFLYKLIYVHW